MDNVSIFSRLTQDDIDEVLALIGWEYEIIRIGVVVWSANCLKTGSAHPIISIPTVFDTKLEAAKAALIAVVEKEYPE